MLTVAIVKRCNSATVLFIIINHWSSSSKARGNKSHLPFTNEEIEEESLVFNHPFLRRAKANFTVSLGPVGPSIAPPQWTWIFMAASKARPGEETPQELSLLLQSAPLPPFSKLAPQWIGKKLQLFSIMPFLPLPFCFVTFPSVLPYEKWKTQKKEKRERKW